MDYKKIIKNQDTRFKILKLLSFIPDKIMVKLQYRIKTGRKLNLKNPQRYTEKLQWYKLNYRNPLMTKCADKYTVREYIESKGLGHILNELYGVYDNVNEINFDKLPNKFVLKTTNDSDTNIFCKDKVNSDLEEIKKKMDKKMKERAQIPLAREWAYNNSKRRIICEKLLEDKDTKDNSINDYKFLCFNGKPEFIVYDVDRYLGHKRNFYDTTWKYLNISSDCPNFGDIVERPEKLEEMLEIAKILSENFPAVRVDLYCVQNKIYFGELTFYPWSGYVKFEPDKFDFVLGEKFNLTSYKEKK